MCHMVFIQDFIYKSAILMNFTTILAVLNTSELFYIQELDAILMNFTTVPF